MFKSAVWETYAKVIPAKAGNLKTDGDWIIDLGPEGGDAGGRVVVQGAPESVVESRSGGHTAAVLKDFLRDRRVQA